MDTRFFGHPPQKVSKTLLERVRSSTIEIESNQGQPFAARLVRTLGSIAVIAFAAAAVPLMALAFQAGSIGGTVVDPLGASVAGTIVLYRDGSEVAQTTSGTDGAYTFTGLPAGRYRLEASAAGFEATMSEAVFVGSTGNMAVDVSVQIGPLEQQISVTAASAELPLAQIGAPVSIIGQDLIERLGKPDLLEALRTVPGLSVVQTGARGGATSVFTRGGEADFTKVLIDGAPANDIGGAFSFDALSTTAIESVEVLRTANSVLHGADAMSGVISVETRRGRTRLPELTYAVDGGNLHTSRNELALGQAVGRFDYFVDASRYDTDNDVPNNEYRNDTLVSRVGFFLGSTTNIGATLRRVETRFGSPNGIHFYGIPDDSTSRARFTYSTVRSVSDIDRVRTTFQYSYTEQDALYTNPTPTGEEFDPFGFGANYLGDPVTITGQNGYSVTGRAILDYGGVYPSVFSTNSRRHLFTGKADLELLDGLDLSFGGRIEDEAGFTTFASLAGRRNHGWFIEGRGNIHQRFFVTGGVGFEDNAVFGHETVPRLSLAFYARQPSSIGAFGETKLMFNIGEGIKAPTVSDDRSSLFAVLSGLDNGPDLIDRFGVGPIGPERVRTLDAGLEQRFWEGRVRAGVSYFNNSNKDLIEFVNGQILPQLGVPADVANSVGFGATINAASFDAQGLELSGDVALANQFLFSGWYTFLDAEVTESFSGGALTPTVNPAFPDIEIGQYAPLVGARPFARPTHSGGLTFSWARGPGQISLTGSFVGKQDGSTFLSDGFFGSSMLLPNKDLSGNYEKVDLSGSYRIRRGVKWYASIENLLNRNYSQTLGFPGLPFTIRSGVSFTFGGEG